MIKKPSGHQETSERFYFYMSLLNAIPTIVSTLSMVNPQISIVKVQK